jgi:hypothetical protein
MAFFALSGDQEISQVSYLKFVNLCIPRGYANKRLVMDNTYSPVAYVYREVIQEQIEAQ